MVLRKPLAIAALVVAIALLAWGAIAAGAAESRDLLRPPPVRRSPLDELTADGRPTPGAIAALHSHARNRVVRIWSGGTHLDVRDPGFDTLGVAFAGKPIADEPRDQGSALVSPIAWAAVDRIETQRSNTLRGAVIGTLLMTIAGARWAGAAGPEPGPGILIVLVFPPAGALVGGLVGAALPRWEHEWPPAGRRR